MTTETQTMTCRITIVAPGLSDKVLNVHPASGKSEKIWLDTVHGVERWAEVRRFLYNHAVRGTAVPDPAPWCGDALDLKSITLRDEDIPMVNLEDGFVFQVKKEVELKEAAPARSDGGLEARVLKMEGTMSSIADALDKISKRLSKPGRRPKEE